jgi:hypothetical protein
MAAPSITDKMEQIKLDDKSSSEPAPREKLFSAQQTQLNDPLLNRLLDIPNLCIAGGLPAVHELKWLKNTEQSDVDFWAYGTKEQRTQAGEEMFRVLLEADKETKAIELGSSVLSFHVPSYRRPLRLIFVHGKEAVDAVHRFERAWYTRRAKFSAFKMAEGDGSER